MKEMEQVEFIKSIAQELFAEFADMVAERLKVLVSTMVDESKPKTYTRKEVCKMFHVTTQTIGAWVKQGKLTPLNNERGMTMLFDAKEVEDAIYTGRIRKSKRA